MLLEIATTTTTTTTRLFTVAEIRTLFKIEMDQKSNFTRLHYLKNN